MEFIPVIAYIGDLFCMLCCGGDINITTMSIVAIYSLIKSIVLIPPIAWLVYHNIEVK
jgi:hypothetical protein